MIKFDFLFLIKLIMYILIPVILIVGIGSIVTKRYSKKISKDNISFYNYTMDYLSALIAIIVVSILLIIVGYFSIHFAHIMRIKHVVTGNEVLYYIVLFTPFVPLTFLLYYIRKLIIAYSGRRESLKSEG